MIESHSNTQPFQVEDKSAPAERVLGEGLRQFNLIISAKQQQQLLMHLQLLTRWNRKLNLTAIDGLEQMVVQHLLDSLSINPHLLGQRILDIGAGGGFPGIPLAALNPDRDFTLLDSRGKRIEFLKHSFGQIGLNNSHAIKSRIEDFRPPKKFDTLVCRAFASLADIYRWTRQLHQPGTRIVAMKGKLQTTELTELDELEMKSRNVVPLRVPFLDAERHAVILEF